VEPKAFQSRRFGDARAERSQPLVYLLGRSALDRCAYCLLLETELQLQVAVDSDFSPVAIWAAMRSRPDLVLVDVDDSTADARDGVQMIRRLRKQARVLVVGAAVDPAAVRVWAACAIHGYVVKDGGIDELRAALKAVLAGKSYFSEGVRDVILNGRDDPGGGPKLSPRETELLPLLARGLTLREAAEQMIVSYKTADSYRTTLLRKVGVRDRVELARYAIREHIIDP
jgi:two-component system nitrate/nitrite response regulator NarL